MIGAAALGAVLVAPPVAGATPAATPIRVPVPTVEGPITTGNGKIVLQSSTFDLASVGYEQEEYFLSGSATSYANAAPLTADGKWTVSPAATAPYKTRIVVYRPIEPKKFDGTVMVEWLNVSGGLDAGANWTMTHVEQIRAGMAWVGVTAQRIGIVGGSDPLISTQALVNADPVRYGSLTHPGDQFAYDIYSQAGQAIRGDASTVLGGLRPKRLVAVGESQSTFWLTSYANALAVRTGVYDAFFLESRAGTAATFEGPGFASGDNSRIRIRDDLRLPVMIVTTESDLVALGYASARQPDSRYFRDWEVAGASHYDTYGLEIGPQDAGTGDADARTFDTMISTVRSLYNGFIDCALPINAGPHTYVARAAVAAMDHWVTTGTPPRKAPRLRVDTAVDPPAFRLDANGNAIGGIRTPHVDAPIATLAGTGQTGSSFCFLFGTTKPFDAAELAALYPSHAAFVRAWDTATDKAVKAGFVLPADAKHIKAAAAQSTIGS